MSWYSGFMALVGHMTGVVLEQLLSASAKTHDFGNRRFPLIRHTLGHGVVPHLNSMTLGTLATEILTVLGVTLPKHNLAMVFTASTRWLTLHRWFWGFLSVFGEHRR